MSLTYSQWVAELANLCVIDAADANFVANLPSTIDDAEQRIYRDLDLLNTVTRDTGLLSTGTRTFNLPSNLGRFVVTNGFNVITPSSTTDPDSGTRNQLVPCSRDVLDMLWPSTTGAAVPALYAMITDQQIIVGPAPDAAYTIEVIGTIRPTPLSTTNTTTYLTLYLPDLFLSASMVFMSAYMRNFGAQADDPKMATSWESHYQTELSSANVEEQRKRYAGGQWSSMQPAPIATPPR
jgi:hypothetical protein